MSEIKKYAKLDYEHGTNIVSESIELTGPDDDLIIRNRIEEAYATARVSRVTVTYQFEVVVPVVTLPADGAGPSGDGSVL